MDVHDQMNPSIRAFVQSILANPKLNSSTEERRKLHELINQLDDPKLSIQRLYLIYLISEHLGDDDDKAIDFFRAFFPIPLRKNLASFIAQIVSLAIGLNSKALLTALTIYLEKEQIKLNAHDIKQLPASLAESSPSFAAALIHIGAFITNQSSSIVNQPEKNTLLTKWLISLNECNNRSITFNGQHIIRYALVGQGQGSSDLHYHILESIENKRVQQLSQQFVIDIASQLSKRGDDDSVSKFAHILIIGVQHGICNSLITSNQLRNSLISQFPQNLLMRALVSMQM